MVGPLTAGVILTASETDAAYWVNAATFLVSALLVARIPARLLQSEEPLSRGHWRDVRDGLGLIVNQRALLTVLVVWTTVAVANGGVNVAEIFMAKDELGAGNAGYTILVAATGVGLIVGSFFAASAIATLGMTRVYGGSLLLMGIGWVAASRSPVLAVAATLAAVATIGNGTAIVCNQLLIQRGAPDAMRGRAVAVLMSIYYGVLGIAMAGAGVLTDATGPRTTWALAGCIYLVASLIAFVMIRRTREAIEAPREVPMAGGIQRLESLLAEVDATRALEQAREPRRLPYIPRRRASG